MPPVMLALSLAVLLALAAWHGRGRYAPDTALWWAAPLALALLWLGGWGVFGSLERFWPVGLGLAAGVGLGALFAWVLPNDAADPHALAPGAAGAAAAVALAWVAPEPVAQANALAALAAGWGVIAVVSALADRAAAPLGLGLTAAVGAAIAWGTSHTVGTELALGAVAGLSALLAIARTLQEGRGPAGAIAGSVLFMAGGAALVTGLGLPWAFAGAVAAGGLLALVALLTPNDASEHTLSAVAVLLIGGVLVVVENRLFGAWGIALGGLGLTLAGRSTGLMPLVTPLVAVFAARAWLQLLLGRTLLTGYGVDLTHPYAFAALVLGGLAFWGAVAVARAVRPSGALLVACALAFALAPGWVGYFLHVEALAALLAGAFFAVFVLGVTPGPARTLLAPGLIAWTAVALLSAPWLVGVLNAPRAERLVVLLAGLALAGAGLVWWYWRVGRRPQAI